MLLCSSRIVPDYFPVHWCFCSDMWTLGFLQVLTQCAGEGLLETTCEGPPLHSAIHACGAAARLEHSAVSVSAAVFGDLVANKVANNSLTSDEGDGPSRGQPRSLVCGSTAAQINYAVSRTLSIGGIWAHRNSQEQDSSPGPFEAGSGGMLHT